MKKMARKFDFSKYKFLTIPILVSCLAFAGILVKKRPTFIPASLFFLKRRFFCAIIAFIWIFWSLYGINKYFLQHRSLFEFVKRLRTTVENKASLILFIFIVLVLLWLRLLIFNNPYLYEYNQGNGAYYVQVLHNLCSGVGPEQTTKASGALYFHTNNYFFASIFSTVPQILPLLLLAPLYCVYPYPPMHVFAMVIVVVIIGSFGIFLAIRALGGSRFLSSLASMGYCLIVWVVSPILFHGAFDNLGFAVYPYVFTFLFLQRWRLFYLSLLLLALISIPYTYSVMALGVMVALFFKAPKQGIIAFLLGFLVMLWSMAVVRESLCGILPENKSLSGISFEFLKKENITYLIDAFKFHSLYIFCLLASLSFVPLLGIRKNKNWNLQVAGLLVFILINAFMGLFRSYSWSFHRNANFVVPAYLSAFMVYCSMGTPEKKRLIGYVLFSGLVSTILCFSWHYPWAGFNVLKPSSDNPRYEQVLSKVKKFVPADASLSYRLEAGLEAYATNRQMAWPLGYHPEGAEYYIIQTKAIRYITEDFPNWLGYLKNIEASKDFKLLYKDDMLIIYKNLNPKPIPRLESVLDWNVLWRGMIPTSCKLRR